MAIAATDRQTETERRTQMRQMAVVLVGGGGVIEDSRKSRNKNSWGREVT